MIKSASAKAKPERSGLNSGLDVIELLARNSAMNLTEIADSLGKSKSGMHGVLATLIERGYAERTEKALYRLGTQAWEIGRSGAPNEIARVAEPHINRLAAEVDEAVILGVLTGFDVLYLDVVESRQAVRLHVNIGERIPANCTSTGIALLATLSDDEIRALAPQDMLRATAKTSGDLDALLETVAATRARGHAVAAGVWREDVAGVAMAIMDESDMALCAVCVSAPLYRVDEEWHARVVRALKLCGAEISDSLARSRSGGVREPAK